MAGRPHSTRLSAALISVSLALSACGETSQTAAPATGSGGTTQAEADLAKQAAAMQKTILQGAAAGGAAGGLIGFGLGDSDDVGTGFSIGLGAGALAGTYVAFVQRKYARREARLNQIKSDLDRNAAEMQTTINVMNQVLAAQKAELTALRASAATGASDQAQLQRELAEANGNLSQMQIAIDGATKRQAEFNEARGLTVARGQAASPIDGDLAALSNQIAQMRGIANDLAASL
ncbi:hypothetical protein [Ruegeria sp. HKCCD8929]|uniref:hypothetical protein n=1 Tax=Ruegeria sp. HKCCD8929 TaxID=2683006 RepID=UPI001488B5BF|nr:hypothetical protein [Ruegeria sp. HKCCD8929]